MSEKVKIGDFVDYTPTAATSTKYKTFDDEEWEVTDEYFATQTGKNSLKWRYMGEDEKGCILLIADRPTDDRLHLSKEDGYINGPSKLNELCKELYSSPLGEARSINVDDVNKVLEAEPVGQYRSINDRFIDNPKNLTIGELIYKEGQRKLTYYTKTPEAGKSINDYVANCYYYEGTEYKGSRTDEYNLIFRNAADINIDYWLASTCVFVCFVDGIVDFNVHCVNDGDVTYSGMFYSSDVYDCDNNPVRPVVCLNSNIKLLRKSDNGMWEVG